MTEMKKLSDFKDDAAFAIIADLMEPIISIVIDPANKPEEDENGLAMFRRFFKNSGGEMRKVFAILSGIPVEEYHCDGISVARNLLTLASDEELLSLFQSREETGGATSSSPVSGTTEAREM